MNQLHVAPEIPLNHPDDGLYGRLVVGWLKVAPDVPWPMYRDRKRGWWFIKGCDHSNGFSNEDLLGWCFLPVVVTERLESVESS